MDTTAVIIIAAVVLVAIIVAVIVYKLMRRRKQMEIYQGDTYSFKFQILDDEGAPVPIECVDNLELTCRKREEGEVKFQKSIADFTYADEYYHGSFTSDDTDLDTGTHIFAITAELGGQQKTIAEDFRVLYNANEGDGE